MDNIYEHLNALLRAFAQTAFCFSFFICIPEKITAQSVVSIDIGWVTVHAFIPSGDMLR